MDESKKLKALIAEFMKSYRTAADKSHEEYVKAIPEGAQNVRIPAKEYIIGDAPRRQFFSYCMDLQKKVDEIWAIARRADRLYELQKAVSSKVRPVPLDLLENDDRKELQKLLAEEKHKVTFLVNAAGFGKYGTYQDLTDKEIDDMIDLNCKAVVHTTYDVLPYMEKRGRVLLMGSASSFQPLPEFNMYAATKAFIVHFGRALHVELKARKISVTCVCPGFVRTEFFQIAQDTKNPDTCKNFEPMYEPSDVVKKALRDAKRGRDMSVLGFNTKVKRLFAKLLPHRLVMKVWMKIK